MQSLGSKGFRDIDMLSLFEVMDYVDADMGVSESNPCAILKNDPHTPPTNPWGPRIFPCGETSISSACWIRSPKTVTAVQSAS